MKMRKVNGISLKDIETKLSNYSSKSCNENIFIEYIRNKLEHFNFFNEKYTDNKSTNKFRWYHHINKNRYDNKLIEAIKGVFGENIYIVYGDWSGNNRLKFISTPITIYIIYGDWTKKETKETF